MKMNELVNIKSNERDEREVLLEDSLSNKEKSFLNKKRKFLKDTTNTAISDLDECLEGNLNNFLTNIKPFNDLDFQKTELILSNKKYDLTDITSLNKQNCIELQKISNNNQENQNNINNTINTICSPKAENDINKKDEIISSPIKSEIQNVQTSKKEENNSENILDLKEKKELNCFALDLLNQNGEFQIIFSKNSDSAYTLKIKEVEIKDDYFEQMKYAKHNDKNNYLKYTVPNNKFWLQRYYYFSKFDKGIKMDKESWYSVTPEQIAKYTAKLIKGKTIIDGFCGCGGNVIQFSKYCSKVYAIDISKSKLDMCKNNCEVYNCDNNIEFILSDFLKMKNKIKADYIFLSPPWGGTEYKKSEIYSIKKFMYPDITEIIRVSLNVADNILFFLPRNLDLDELFDLCSTIKNEIKEGSGKNLFFDIRIIKSNNRIKSLLIIFGHHIKDYFSKHKLENFLKKYYEKIDEKSINNLYSAIKASGLYRFFREEYIYRTTKAKSFELCYLNEYVKNILCEK